MRKPPSKVSFFSQTRGQGKKWAPLCWVVLDRTSPELAASRLAQPTGWLSKPGLRTGSAPRALSRTSQNLGEMRNAKPLGLQGACRLPIWSGFELKQGALNLWSFQYIPKTAGFKPHQSESPMGFPICVHKKKGWVGFGGLVWIAVHKAKASKELPENRCALAGR